jgi:hypothetical protein
MDTPSLDELRRAARSEAAGLRGRIHVANQVADVRALLGDRRNAFALFQVASQFNLLEMTGPDVTPEMGVTRYVTDLTQGPACAIAAGAATLYRNYLAPVHGVSGQTEAQQIDCLADIGTALGNGEERLWEMRNGYAMCTSSGLAALSAWFGAASTEDLETLRAKLRIGVHWDIEVTRGAQTGHLVSQAFCSALPVAYGRLPPKSWEPFARLVLEAAYEATLWAAVLNAARTGNRRVYLTALGGGAFGNAEGWIAAAMWRAFQCLAQVGLEVHVVSFSQVPDLFRALEA